jgi:hypothetical protein
MTRAWPLMVAVTCLACASVIGIPNDTASFCSSNTGHTYCEDFDLGDPLSRMSFHVANGGAQLAIAPSDDSPPNLLDLTSPMVGPKSQTLAGFDKEFTSSKFGALHIEADMRIVTNGKPFTGQAGFMLITDKQGGCIAIAMVPQGIGAFSLDNPNACGGIVMAQGGGGDAGSDGGSGPMMGQELGGLPAMNQWVHLRVDVTPSSSGDGSGTLTFDVVGQPTPYKALAIGKGTLNPVGTPLVAFSVAGLPGSGPVELQLDNITVDLSAP